jgi:hypothetical protein
MLKQPSALYLIEISPLQDTIRPQGRLKEISIATFDIGSSRGARWLLCPRHVNRWSFFGDDFVQVQDHVHEGGEGGQLGPVEFVVDG